jgi:hypothetical protein
MRQVKELYPYLSALTFYVSESHIPFRTEAIYLDIYAKIGWSVGLKMQKIDERNAVKNDAKYLSYGL